MRESCRGLGVGILSGWIWFLAAAAASAVPAATAPAGPDIAEAIAAYERWWYQAAPFPDDAARAIVRDEVGRGSTNPHVLFWLSRDILRQTFGQLTASERERVRELMRAAAEGGLDVAIVLQALAELDAIRRPAPADAARGPLEQIADALRRREPEAARVLGRLLRTGDRGLGKDLERSEEVLEAAVRLGHVRAYGELALTKKELGAFGDALAALRRCAEAGDADAQILLGKWHRDGVVSRVDVSESERWFQRAADSGHPVGKLELARSLGKADDPTRHEDALRLLRESAEVLDEAKFELARAYLSGAAGAPVRRAEAEKILRELATRGHVEANRELGMALLTGLWRPQDVQGGLTHLRTAARAGDAQAAAVLRLYQDAHPAETDAAR